MFPRLHVPLFENRKRSISGKVSKHQLLKGMSERMKHKVSKSALSIFNSDGNADRRIVKRSCKFCENYFEHSITMLECTLALNSCLTIFCYMLLVVCFIFCVIPSVYKSLNLNYKFLIFSFFFE